MLVDKPSDQIDSKRFLCCGENKIKFLQYYHHRKVYFAATKHVYNISISGFCQWGGGGGGGGGGGWKLVPKNLPASYSPPPA